MKKVMILGAGVYQVPLIKAVIRNKYNTIVASIFGMYPGGDMADNIAYINTTDYKSVYKLAKKIGIDAILTTGTDGALITVGYVCDKLGTKGISFEAAKLATYKALMKEAFEKSGVSTAKYRVVNSLKETKEASSQIGYPVMLKFDDVKEIQRLSGLGLVAGKHKGETKISHRRRKRL